MSQELVLASRMAPPSRPVRIKGSSTLPLLALDRKPAKASAPTAAYVNSPVEITPDST